MKTAFTLAATLCILAGCQGPAIDWQSELLPTPDLQTGYQAALDVISKDYVVERASFADGKIETRPLIVEKTGNERQLGAYISSGRVQNFRRIITCWIERAPPDLQVRVRAVLQREGTAQAETLFIEQQEGADRRAAGAEGQWRHLDVSRTSYWANVGRDQEVEKQLLSRILARVQEIAKGESAAPAAAGSAKEGEALRREATEVSKPGPGADSGASAEQLRRETEKQP
jgi:hypothetical protein